MGVSQMNKTTKLLAVLGITLAIVALLAVLVSVYHRPTWSDEATVEQLGQGSNIGTTLKPRTTTVRFVTPRFPYMFSTPPPFFPGYPRTTVRQPTPRTVRPPPPRTSAPNNSTRAPNNSTRAPNNSTNVPPVRPTGWTNKPTARPTMRVTMSRVPDITRSSMGSNATTIRPLPRVTMNTTSASNTTKPAFNGTTTVRPPVRNTMNTSTPLPTRSPVTMKPTTTLPFPTRRTNATSATLRPTARTGTNATSAPNRPTTKMTPLPVTKPTPTTSRPVVTQPPTKPPTHPPTRPPTRPPTKPPATTTTRRSTTKPLAGRNTPRGGSGGRSARRA